MPRSDSPAVVPSEAALALADSFVAGFQEFGRRGRAGSRLGRGTGASLEFEDRRNYVAGDDLRHLDWRAFARTDQHMVRLYREEVQPFVDLMLDASRSMNADPAKSQLALDLGVVLEGASRRAGFDVRWFVLADALECPLAAQIHEQGQTFAGTTPLPAVVKRATGRLRGGSVRVLLSDFLLPAETGTMIRTLAANAGAVLLIQVLSQADADPKAGSALRLTDAETQETVDLVRSESAVRDYKARLARVSETLQQAAIVVGGHFEQVCSADPLAKICQDQLTPRQILIPR